MTSSPPLPKRTWRYVQEPAAYDISPCPCGNREPQWSEFQDRLWCARCELDFIPASWGVFDGPIPVQVAGLLGLSFDRVNLETRQVEKFDAESGEWKV